jgi:hypothetical protein
VQNTLLDARDLAVNKTDKSLPIILATWDTEIKRITVQGQPGQIVGNIDFYSKSDEKALEIRIPPGNSMLGVRMDPPSRIPEVRRKTIFIAHVCIS